MSWIEAIKSGDIVNVEKMVEEGASIKGKVDGKTPLTLVKELIKESIENKDWQKEENYKKIASILIVHGASCAELGHEGGEATDICSAVNRYIVFSSAKHGKDEKVKELIEDEKIWFKEDKDKEILLKAIKERDLETVEDLLEAEKVNFTYEQ